MNAKTMLALVSLFFAGTASAQGFAGLGGDASGFAHPQRGEELQFPRDHGAHPDFRIEWWYLTSNLQSADGTPYGIQWTLFRLALEPREAEGWDSPQVWLGHAAVTTPADHFYTERRGRGGTGQAGVTAAPFEAWIDEWAMASTGDGLEALTLSASGPDFAYDLELTADGPLVLHGDRGYSVKSAGGQASYYYSQPHYQASGTLTLPEGDISVTGHCWLDREWSSQPLAEDQTGWDWFSLRFDSGDKLMGFVLRGASGAFTSGTWIGADGRAEALPPGAFNAEPLAWSSVAGREVPTTWHATLPARGLSVTVEALNPQSWMGTMPEYWEGPVTVSGSHAGTGYLEMTGYE